MCAMPVDGPAPAATAPGCPRLDLLPVRELAGHRRVAEAASRAARMRGLARLDEMPPNYALHIPRCRSVHTFGMRFPVHVIFCGRSMVPVSVRGSVPPGRIVRDRRAAAVVELPAVAGRRSR